MSLRIVFKGAAKDELEEAAAWYNDHQRGLGEAFLNEAAEALDPAARLPEWHPFIFRSFVAQYCVGSPTPASSARAIKHS